MKLVLLAACILFCTHAFADSGFDMPSEDALNACNNAKAEVGVVLTCSTKTESWQFKQLKGTTCLIQGRFRDGKTKSYVDVQSPNEMFRSLHVASFPGAAPDMSFHLVFTADQKQATGYLIDWASQSKT